MKSIASGNPIRHIEHQFHVQLPEWLFVVLTALVIAAAIVTLLKPLGPVLTALCRGATAIVRRRSPELEYRQQRRRRFANHVDGQLRLLSGKEDWADERFAELEAEVEVEGREWVYRWLRGSPSRKVQLRRERSLSRALERSTEQLVVLEGEPGAGKSVALRHIAQRLARKAAEARQPHVIPLYVNLKEFRPDTRPVTSTDVHDFVVASLNRVNDRDVEQFLDEEFDNGLQDGSWLVLLDSFDEIPDVLSATEADAVVQEYSEAVYSFLHGMHKSRGIIASREFRGPKALQLPRFTIMPLTARQRRDLVRRSGLRPEAQRQVVEQLAVAEPDLRQMSANPMFLSLVCEHVREFGVCPGTSHEVFEAYLARRFARDAERIAQRYRLTPEFVRSAAETIAFAMAWVPGLGLAPSRSDLYGATTTVATMARADYEGAVDALEYIKIGRAADESASQTEKLFTFAHRRFQEYFATCVVLREPGRVSVDELLEDGRWRETAVTILQTQPVETLAPMFAGVRERLDAALAQIGTAQVTPATEEPQELPPSDPYTWPKGILHLLELLNAGIGRRIAEVPADILDVSGQILTAAWRDGRRRDRKWVTSLAVVAARPTAIQLLKDAFASDSALLSNAAYESTNRLPDPPDELLRGIRAELGRLACTGKLRDQRLAVIAGLRKLPDPAPMLRSVRLLASMQIVSAAFVVAMAVAYVATSNSGPYAFALFAVSLPLDWAVTWLTIKSMIAFERPTDMVDLMFGPAIFRISVPAMYLELFVTGQHAAGGLTVIVLLAVWYLLWPFAARLVALHSDLGILPAVGLGPALLAFALLSELVRSFGLRLPAAREIPRLMVAGIGALIKNLAFFLAALSVPTGFLLLGQYLHRTPPGLYHIYLAFWIALAGAIAMAVAIVMARSAVISRLALRGLRQRATPLHLDELAVLAGRIAQHDLIRVVRTLRERQELCSDEVPELLDDLAAEQEKRDSAPSLPSSVREWLDAQPRSVRMLLRHMDSTVLDEICVLVEAAEVRTITPV